MTFAGFNFGGILQSIVEFGGAVGFVGMVYTLGYGRYMYDSCRHVWLGVKVDRALLGVGLGPRRPRVAKKYMLIKELCGPSPDNHRLTTLGLGTCLVTKGGLRTGDTLPSGKVCLGESYICLQCSRPHAMAQGTPHTTSPAKLPSLPYQAPPLLERNVNGSLEAKKNPRQLPSGGHSSS